MTKVSKVKNSYNPRKEYIQKKPSQSKRAKQLFARNHPKQKLTSCEEDQSSSFSEDKLESINRNDNPADDPNNQGEKKEPPYAKSNASFEKIPSNVPFIQLTSLSMMSRLIYPNPVSFLTTQQKNGDIFTDGINVMTLSWIMPTNNSGGLAFTLNKRRHTADLLRYSDEFCLSIPTALQRDQLLLVGKCSGRSQDKFCGSIPALTTTTVGTWDSDSSLRPIPDTWRDMNVYDIKTNTKTAYVAKSLIRDVHRTDSRSNQFSMLADDDSDDEGGESDVDLPEHQSIEQISSKPAGAQGQVKAVSESVAHIVCSVESMTDASDSGHYLVLAQMKSAYVHPSYWSNRGKCFVGKSRMPPLLTFLGSQAFGFVTASGDEFPMN